MFPAAVKQKKIGRSNDNRSEKKTCLAKNQKSQMLPISGETSSRLDYLVHKNTAIKKSRYFDSKNITRS